MERKRERERESCKSAFRKLCEVPNGAAAAAVMRQAHVLRRVASLRARGS
jgi:hypothetical protein